MRDGLLGVDETETTAKGVGGDGTPQRVLANNNATLQRVQTMGNHKTGYRALMRAGNKRWRKTAPPLPPPTTKLETWQISGGNFYFYTTNLERQAPRERVC